MYLQMTHTVTPGQIYQDRDTRDGIRKVEVISIDRESWMVDVKNIITGRITKIQYNRFSALKPSRGYKLIGESK